MNPAANTTGLEIALWALGILFSLVSALGFVILRGIHQQGRDTNDKVTTQGSTMARLEEASRTSANEISHLREKTDTLALEVAKTVGARDLAEAIVRAFDERSERRRTPARRAEDHR